MDKRQIIELVVEAVVNSQLTPEELVTLLEVEVQELLRKFPKKLVDNAEKFGVYAEEVESPRDAENGGRGWSSTESEET